MPCSEPEGDREKKETDDRELSERRRESRARHQDDQGFAEEDRRDEEGRLVQPYRSSRVESRVLSARGTR
jgi:hypothetical protein